MKTLNAFFESPHVIALLLSGKLLRNYNDWFYIAAVICPEPPTFQPLTPIGESNLDLVNDPPQYMDVAQFWCPEGFVFETYDTIPDENGTYDMIPDLYQLNLTCASYADWMPLKVPECIRNYSLIEKTNRNLF